MTDMQPAAFRTPWREQKSKLRAKFPSLTEGDVTFVYGQKNEMLEKLARKLGITEDELSRIIASF